MSTVSDSLHRRDHRRHRHFAVREALGWVAVTLAATVLVGLVVAYYALVPRFIEEQWEQSNHLPGRVLASHETGGDDGDEGTATVRYGADSDHMHRATVAVGDVDRWPVGQAVTVLVDPTTSEVTLPGENFTPESFKDTAAAIGLLAVVIGGAGLRLLPARRPAVGASS